MANQINLQVYFDVIDKGQTYNSSCGRYGKTGKAYCDFCQKTLSSTFIGYDKIDLCLTCSNNLIVYMANKKINANNNHNNNHLQPPIPAPIQDRTKNQFLTRMMQKQFTDRTKNTTDMIK